MKVLSFQPGSLYQNGGMGRILRRIYEGRQTQIKTLYVNYGGQIIEGEIEEIAVDAFPIQKPWMRWKLRTFFSWTRNTLFYGFTKKKITQKAETIEFDVLHVINHGTYSSVLCDKHFLTNKKLWSSFHDHFNLCSSYEETKLLWCKSDRRLVISEELGIEYQRLFSKKPFEIITDGLYSNELSKPKSSKQNDLLVYFGGLLHIEYYELFMVLADALDSLIKDNFTIKLVLRGTQNLDFLSNRKFSVEYRKDFILDVKQELDLADIVYLPIKFNEPDFYLYSLSTKMVGYLGASGVILYHGPSNSAACNLLYKNDAAFLCNTLQLNDMIDTLNDILDNKGKQLQVSKNAKELAIKDFDLIKIQNRFWNN